MAVARGLRRTLRRLDVLPWRQPAFLAALAATLLAFPFVGCLVLAGLRPAVPSGLWWFLLAYPLLEELAFRGLLQGACRERWPASARPCVAGLTPANVVVSLVFVAAHAWRMPPAWAVAVLPPSLLFGWARDRFGSLAAPVLLHVAGNAAYALACQILVP